MGIKKVQPTTPGRRQATFDDFSDITAVKPYKPLTLPLHKSGGRNSQGKITIRHRGGGAKRLIRIVDFKQDKYDIPARVKTIEYDPNRGARLALVAYADGEKRYIIAVHDLKPGDTIMSSREKIEVKLGNRMPLQFIPAGVEVSGIELYPGSGAKIARGAGNLVTIMASEGDLAQLRLPSGEIRFVPAASMATVGKVSNADRRLVKLGKAGRSRHLGIRPTVRGTAMNPVDHPHGGGEGNQPIGLRAPKTPWGRKALGVKTRNPKNASSRLILQRRNAKK